jgi:predicted permease
VLPYLAAGSEIGMLGYSLYILLFGAENVYRLALFDVGHALFIFPIFLTSLNAAQGERDLKTNIKNMLLSPIIIMLVLGMIFGISGLGSVVMNGPLRETVDRIYELTSSANIVLMLSAMGYGISFTAEKIKDCLGAMLIRFAGMAASTVIGLLFLRFTVGLEKPTACALILAFSMPPVYMLSVYVKDREENEFAATMTSIYTLFSILLFLIMAAIVR